ncbi:MAG: hypothetical protein WC564_04330 [Patescibacteria group bacterium]|jgi:hypothetical protein
MSYVEDIQFFRDLEKNPDIYGVHIDEETKREIEAEKALKSKSENSTEKKIETFGPTAENYRKIVDAVTNLSLKPEFSHDSLENKLLSERKKIILDFLNQVLGDVQRYVSTVNNFNLIFNKQSEAKDRDGYLADIKSADEERRAVHNRLISDLKICIRLLNINLNADFDPRLRFDSERKMPDRRDLSDSELKAVLEKREYIKFDKKNFFFNDLPSNPQNERDFIKDWSFELYGDLTHLSSELKEALNEKDLD